MERIRLSRVEEVEGDDEETRDERVEPRMSDGDGSPAAEERLDFPPFPAAVRPFRAVFLLLTGLAESRADSV